MELRSPGDGPAVAGSDVAAGITLAPAGDDGARGDESGDGPQPEGTGAGTAEADEATAEAAGADEATAGVAEARAGAAEAEAAGADEAQAEAEAEAEAGASPWAGRLAWGSLVAVLVVLAVSAGRAIVTGWVPVGDSALIAVRSRDVLGGGQGGDLPLLGMWRRRRGRS